MNINKIINEVINEFEWEKEMVAGKPIIPNRIVYHISGPNNRNSILNNGLQTRVGDSYSSWTGGKKAVPAIFATNSSLENVTSGITEFGSDVWAIDTTKINNKWFVDKHFSEFEKYGIVNPHIVTFENIDKEALNLVIKGGRY